MFEEGVKGRFAISIPKEDVLPVIAALGDVMRTAGQYDACDAGHGWQDSGLWGGGSTATACKKWVAVPGADGKAVAPSVTEQGVFMIGTNAGPHELAGSQCNRMFFTTSWQNDQTPEAMGEYLQKQGVNDVYLMAPNYAAGKDMLTGFKRYFKGRIVDEVYTKLGQQDYQAEISQLRAKKPRAVFVFYPGAMGINFIRQYDQAGLHGKIPLYSAFTVDQTTLPALGDAARGLWSAGYWSSELDNPANREYVSQFRKKYGYTPSFYGAEAYDGIMLIDAAVRAVKGNLADKEGLIKAFDAAGRFRMIWGLSAAAGRFGPH